MRRVECDTDQSPTRKLKPSLAVAAQMRLDARPMNREMHLCRQVLYQMTAMSPNSYGSRVNVIAAESNSRSHWLGG